MKYALNLSEDKRILSATFEKYAVEGMPLVNALPEGEVSDYLYVNGNYVYDPLPEQSSLCISPRNIKAGEFITVNGVMYRATANIPNGEPIVTGQNAIETTIEEQLAELAKGE